METTKTMKTTKTYEDRPTIILTPETRNEWVELFNTQAKFPQNTVPCSHCNKGVVMFADNLNLRVLKFGGPAELLENFVCRTCENTAKNAVKAQAAEAKAALKADKQLAREAKRAEKEQRKADRVAAKLAKETLAVAETLVDATETEPLKKAASAKRK